MASGIAQPLEKQFKMLLSMQPQEILQSSAPEFLKIAALEQRNKAAQPPAQPPQGTVADKVVQQSMSPPGNVGLPSVLPTPPRAPMPPEATPTPPIPSQLAINQGVGGLPADMTMASGGIVSFAGGGSPYQDPEYLKQVKSAQYFLTGGRRGMEEPDFSDSLDAQIRYALATGNEDLLNRLKGMATQDEILAGYGVGRLPRDILPAMSASEKAPYLDEMSSDEFRRASGSPSRWSYNSPLPSKRDSKDYEMEPSPKFGEEYGGLKGILGGGERSFAGLSEMSAFPNAPKIVHPEQFDLNKHLANQEITDKAYGVDPEFWKKQGTSVDEQLATREKEYTRDKWSALAEAGARIMQTPGSIGQAIGAGAEVGLGALKESTASYRRDRQTLQQMQTKLAAAQQAEAQGRSAEAQQMRMQMEDQYRNSINREAEIEFNRNLKEFELKEGRALTEAELKDKWARAQYDAKVRFLIASSTSNASVAKERLQIAKEMADIYDISMTPAEYTKFMEAAQAKTDEQYSDGSLDDIDPKEAAKIRAQRTKENLMELLDEFKTVRRGMADYTARQAGLGFSATRVD